MVGKFKRFAAFGSERLGKISHGGCSHSARKRYWSRVEAVTANLRRLDAIYRQVLAPESGTTLSGPISVAG